MLDNPQRSLHLLLLSSLQGENEPPYFDFPAEPSSDDALDTFSNRDSRARTGDRLRYGSLNPSPPTVPLTLRLAPMVDNCLLDTSTRAKTPLRTVDLRFVSRDCGSSHRSVSLPIERVISLPDIVTSCGPSLTKAREYVEGTQSAPVHVPETCT